MAKRKETRAHNDETYPADFLLVENPTEEEYIKGYQELINTGLAWKMEGSVGREAMALIRHGRCILGKKGSYDAYGNYVPSRTEVQPGTKGSIEYATAARIAYDSE